MAYTDFNQTQTFGQNLIVSGNVTASDPTVSTHLTTKNYVDAVDAYLSGQINLYSDHVNLSSLEWSNAGHIIDTNVDFGNNVLSGVDAIHYNLNPTHIDTEGATHWNTSEHTLDIHTGIGPIIQVGKELLFDVYNYTSATILDGSSIHTNGSATSGAVEVSPANASNYYGISNKMLIATMDIPPYSLGLATAAGKVNDIDTSAFAEGDTLYVSTSAGQFTNIAPEFPYYAIETGQVSISDAVSGAIQFVDIGDASDTFNNFFNGTIRESILFTVSSDGATVSGTLSSQEISNDITMIFSDGFSVFNTPKTVTLTAGTESTPQINYVYIRRSTKLLESSTTSWPLTEHIKVAQVFLRTAAKTQADDSLINHNWDDYVRSTTGQGNLSHVTNAIRVKNSATWLNGTAATCTVSGSPSDVLVSTTAGNVMLLRSETFEAMSNASGDACHIVNHPTSGYLDVTNLNGQTLDANGVTLENSAFSMVLWGVANVNGETSHLMVNLPTGVYSKNAPDQAISDPYNYSIYSIPDIFRSVGFLIARFTFTLDSGGTEWTLEDTEDLRGKTPNTTAGGGAGGTGVIDFTQLTDTPSSYVGTGNYFVKVAAGETALEFVPEDTSVTDYLSGVIDINTSNIALNDSDITYLSGAIDQNTTDILWELSGSTRIVPKDPSKEIYIPSVSGTGAGTIITSDAEGGLEASNFTITVGPTGGSVLNLTEFSTDPLSGDLIAGDTYIVDSPATSGKLLKYYDGTYKYSVELGKE